MAQFQADQNTLGFFYESGTYAIGSPGAAFGNLQWIGQVQSSEITENPNVISTRYLGTNDRNVQQFNDGPLDFEGTFTYFPQDWKFLLFALGSVVEDGSPSPFTHHISEINNDDANLMTSGTDNPFISFGLEDSWKSSVTNQHFVRTVRGAMVNTMEISVSQGEPVNVEVGWMAQEVAFGSQAPSGITEATTRPFLWSDVIVELPDNTVFDEVRELTMSINNNLESRHYTNGSRVIARPFPLNRDYEISMVLDGTSNRTQTLMGSYWDTAGSANTFNMLVNITVAAEGAGSRDAFFVFSGCRITELSSPTPLEGMDEHTLTIIPETMVGSIADTIELYNAWKTQS